MQDIKMPSIEIHVHYHFDGEGKPQATNDGQTVNVQVPQQKRQPKNYEMPEGFYTVSDEPNGQNNTSNKTTTPSKNNYRSKHPDKDLRSPEEIKVARKSLGYATMSLVDVFGDNREAMHGGDIRVKLENIMKQTEYGKYYVDHKQFRNVIMLSLRKGYIICTKKLYPGNAFYKLTDKGRNELSIIKNNHNINKK